MLNMPDMNSEDDGNGEMDNIIRREHNGETLPKQRNLENNGQNGSKQMEIRNLIHNNEPIEKKKSAMSQRKTSYKKKAKGSGKVTHETSGTLRAHLEHRSGQRRNQAWSTSSG